MNVAAPAFKEWQVIVEALGHGEQIVILRKGGIAEGRGGFAMQANRFWLFPTRFHAQREKTKPALARWFEDSSAAPAGPGGPAGSADTANCSDRASVTPIAPPPPAPQPGLELSGSAAPMKTVAVPALTPVIVQYFAEVVAAPFLATWDDVARLDPYHGWTEATVRERFDWSRPPGLHAIVVRVHRAAQPITLVPTEAMSGCKSWIDLPAAFDAQPSTPVLDDATFTARRAELGL